MKLSEALRTFEHGPTVKEDGKKYYRSILREMIERFGMKEDKGSLFPLLNETPILHGPEKHVALTERHQDFWHLLPAEVQTSMNKAHNISFLCDVFDFCILYLGWTTEQCAQLAERIEAL